ncbi:hypothetical protein SERLA73DRAFT_171717 [Serpula lacrymans var. lacrymans S7.3]|uniref:BTB domain-containing protein n=1 Tax=Serpula lacrymans var. lacrymans (strain S7.3) TaxID=936435 RepID=F8QCD4_SERL3|nr:hypothetical protein SERLA73DRAFT_171717 [Serpula lacrymans var. lacrymans S7.3]
MPTPGLSPDLTADQDPSVFISTTFFPGADINPHLSDLVLSSSDSVLFYVHAHILLASSDNGFNSLLPFTSDNRLSRFHTGENHIAVAEDSSSLNIVLHNSYDISSAQYSPSFETLVSAVVSLHTYGISLDRCLVPSTPLYNSLLSHAPLRPLELYILAASYDRYELAVSTSSHLLSFTLSSLTDDMVDKMGAKYLKRLFFLHFGRTSALKRLLLPPPHPHAPTNSCSFSDQKSVSRAWALVAAYLAWDARPDMSTHTIKTALCSLEEQVDCDICRTSLNERIRDLVIQWSLIKVSISFTHIPWQQRTI